MAHTSTGMKAGHTGTVAVIPLNLYQVFQLRFAEKRAAFVLSDFKSDERKKIRNVSLKTRYLKLEEFSMQPNLQVDKKSQRQFTGLDSGIHRMCAIE